MASHIERRSSMESVCYSSQAYPCHLLSDMTIVNAPTEERFRLLRDSLLGQLNFQAIHTLAHYMFESLAGEKILANPFSKWGRGFVEECITLLLDYLSTIDTLVGNFLADGSRLGYLRHFITDLLALLGMLFKMIAVSGSCGHLPARQWTCPGCIKVAQFLRSLCPKIQRVFNGIWDIREALLASERDAVERPFCPLWFTIYHAINYCMTPFVSTELLHDYIQPASSLPAAGRVALTVWIYATTREDAQLASDLLDSYTTDSLRLKPTPRVISAQPSTLYVDVAHGCTGPRHIFNAILRDLKHTQGEQLAAISWRAMTLRPTTEINMLVRREHTLVMCCLAACRHEVCSGRAAEGDQYSMDNVISKFVGYLLSALLALTPIQTSKGLVPENSIYAIIPILGKGIVSHLPDEALRVYGSERLQKALNNCSTLLRMHRRHPDIDHRAGHKPPSSNARRFTETAWKGVRDTMVDDGWHRVSHKKGIYSAWVSLGRALDESTVGISEEVVQAEVEVIKRCAWAECMCSVYKPMHLLKVCTGCSAVAYCNSRCQKADRKVHRQFCSKRVG